jgi:hypothetical protein
MGFDISPSSSDSQLRVLIDYELPTRGPSRVFGKLFGRMYAQWCTRQMVRDAQKTFVSRALRDRAPP